MTTVQTLVEIDEALTRDETTLAGYREHLAGREAEGQDTTHAHELVRIVERRLRLLRERRGTVQATEALTRRGRGDGQSR